MGILEDFLGHYEIEGYAEDMLCKLPFFPIHSKVEFSS